MGSGTTRSLALAIANEQFVFGALDVVDGQGQAFAQTQAAHVNEFDGGAVAAKANAGQQIMNLLAGQDGGQSVVILGADLPKDGPVGVPQQVFKELTRSSDGLADGFGLPTLSKFDEQEVVAQSGLGELGGIAGEVLVDETQLTVIGVAGAIGVVT